VKARRSLLPLERLRLTAAASFTKFFVKKFLGLDKGVNTPLSLCGSRRTYALVGARQLAPVRRKNFAKLFPKVLRSKAQRALNKILARYE